MKNNTRSGPVLKMASGFVTSRFPQRYSIRTYTCIHVRSSNKFDVIACVLMNVVSYIVSRDYD